MENDQHNIVDLYVPRKCSSSSRIISAKDHGSIQIDFADVDPKTRRAIPNSVTRYAICGALRAMGESDNCLLRLAQRDGLIPEKI